MVKKYANDAVTILDLGCGSCCTTKKLRESGRKITSLDVVDKGVCVRPQLYDGHTIPFPDNTFDLGICAFVLHHTEKQLEILKELKRTCNLVLVLEDTPKTKSEWKYALKHSKSDWGACAKCFRNTSSWEMIFQQLNFKILAKEMISKWTCPFSKKPFFYPVTCTAYLLQCHSK